MERTIKVTGKGKISVKPDRIRLYITQQASEKTYEKVIQESADKKRSINEVLKDIGFKNEDLKTLQFNVDTEYDEYRDNDNHWRKTFKGYRYTHRMKLEFPADNMILSKVLGALMKCPAKPEFSIEYTIADPEASKNELLGNAVADSRAKAEVLTRAAGVKLKDILTIDYSWGEIDFAVRPMMLEARCMVEEGAGVNMDIEADDITVTDTVTVIWGIE